MKRVLPVLALAAVTVAAFAQTAKVKQLECAVMKGHNVDIAKATKDKMYADYKGRRYFFCCGGCPPAFKENPGKYADKKKSIPTPKKSKK